MNNKVKLAKQILKERDPNKACGKQSYFKYKHADCTNFIFLPIHSLVTLIHQSKHTSSESKYAHC